MDVLGCWTCHGRASSGAGGEGEPLQGTLLPLSLFVKELRLPAETMPPFSPLVATDDELAIVYAWLEGADPVVAPPPVRLSLVGVGGEPAGAGVELELELTAVAEASGKPGIEFKLNSPLVDPETGYNSAFRPRNTLCTSEAL